MLSNKAKAIKYNVDTNHIKVDLATGVITGVRGNPRKLGSKNGRPVLALQAPDSLPTSVYAHQVVAYAAWGDTSFAQNLDIHHINGDKQDNRVENLALLDISEHKAMHTAWHVVWRSGKIVALCLFEEDAEKLK